MDSKVSYASLCIKQDNMDLKKKYILISVMTKIRKNDDQIFHQLV